MCWCFFLLFCFSLTLISKWYQVVSDQEKEDISVEKIGRKKKIRTTTLPVPGEALPKKRQSKEDKTSAMEEKKLRKEVSVLYMTFLFFCFFINCWLASIIQQERLEKAASKAEEAERKRLEKEKKKWEKGKLALKSIVAEIDTKVLEGSIGGEEFLYSLYYFSIDPIDVFSLTLFFLFHMNGLSL